MLIPYVDSRLFNDSNLSLFRSRATKVPYCRTTKKCGIIKALNKFNMVPGDVDNLEESYDDIQMIVDTINFSAKERTLFFPFSRKSSSIVDHGLTPTVYLKTYLSVGVYVVDQFYPWFKLFFLLFLGMAIYDDVFETMENKS